MSFANLVPLDFFLILIMLDIEECVSVILLQLILFPFSHFVILESPYVYASIVPQLPLVIASPLFVYLA